jgi:probable HAF family extracellular repeat protein
MMRRAALIVMSLAAPAALVGAGFAAGSERQAKSRWVAVKLSGTNSSAVAINNRGQIVGWSDRGSCYHAVLWEKGKMRDLGTLGGACSMAKAINDRGEVVGWSLKTGENWKTERAFLWTNGKMRDLGTVQGPHPDSEADAINERGQVVGRTNIDSGISHAWLWEKGRMRDLGTLPGRIESGATDINDLGQVVGWSSTAWGSKRHANSVFLYDKGHMRNLGIPTDYGGAAINNRGMVVTGKYLSRAGVVTRVQHWSPNGLNDRGQIVGSTGYTPVLWQTGKTTTLPTPGWEKSYYGSNANDINEHNQIVGTSEDYGDVKQAWLWTLKAAS